MLKRFKEKESNLIMKHATLKAEGASENADVGYLIHSNIYTNHLIFNPYFSADIFYKKDFIKSLKKKEEKHY